MLFSGTSPVALHRSRFDNLPNKRVQTAGVSLSSRRDHRCVREAVQVNRASDQHKTGGQLASVRRKRSNISARRLYLTVHP